MSTIREGAAFDQAVVRVVVRPDKEPYAQVEVSTIDLLTGHTVSGCMHLNFTQVLTGTVASNTFNTDGPTLGPDEDPFVGLPGRDTINTREFTPDQHEAFIERCARRWTLEVSSMFDPNAVAQVLEQKAGSVCRDITSSSHLILHAVRREVRKLELEGNSEKVQHYYEVLGRRLDGLIKAITSDAARRALSVSSGNGIEGESQATAAELEGQA